MRLFCPQVGPAYALSSKGKTPEITIDHARKLLASIKVSLTVKTKQGKPVEEPLVVGLRDRAILATSGLYRLPGRAGGPAPPGRLPGRRDAVRAAVPGEGRQEAGKSRCGTTWRAISGPISRRWASRARPRRRRCSGRRMRRTRKLTGNALTSKRDLRAGQAAAKDAGLPKRLSPHSFRVTAITDLLTQGVPLEDVQYLAGHAEPRTTGLYDRRQKRVTRNIVERISI